MVTIINTNTCMLYMAPICHEWETQLFPLLAVYDCRDMDQPYTALQ